MSEMPHTTVWTNGCFDIIHRGHIELLKFCKSLGDRVVVGLNSDKSVRSLKGDGRPLVNQEDRKIILESIKYVDKVLIFDEATPYNIIKSVKPDLIVKGGDYKPEEVVGNDLCKVVIFDYVDGYSTSKILQCAGDR